MGLTAASPRGTTYQLVAAISIVCASVAALVIFAARANAAPLVVNVTSTADTHTPGTLRDAVDQANAGIFDNVTINLPAGTYALDLCAPPEDDNNEAGDLDLTQAAPVTIAGVGGTPTIAMTCAGERVIDRLGTGLFSLTAVRITGGHANGSGGGVRANSAVTVTGATFDGNRANGWDGTDEGCYSLFPAIDGGPAAGGAIASTDGVAVTNSAFTDNRATGGTGGVKPFFAPSNQPCGAGSSPGPAPGGPSFGGAISAQATVVISGGTFVGNQSVGGNGGLETSVGYRAGGGDAEGGAVWAAGGATVAATTLAGNGSYGAPTGGSARGGALLSGAATVLIDSRVTNNAATGAAGNLWGCEARPGGAATGGGISSSGPMDLVRTELSTNLATGAAGGSIDPSALPFCPNPSAAPGPGGPASGAGAAVQGDVHVDASTVTGNVATAGDSGTTCPTASCTYAPGVNASGGGILAGGASVIVDSTVADNAAVSKSGSTPGFSYGGGIFSSAGSTITDTSFLNNHGQGAIAGAGVPAGQSAGGGLWDNGAITIDGSTFAANHADNGPGGDASAGGQSGGAASVSPITATNSTFDANVANNISAGAALGAPTLTLEYVTVTGNTGSSALRGGTLVTSRSVIADQIGGVLCEFGGSTSGGYNWADDTSCSLTDATDVQTGTDPLLAALADNGGPTFTRLPAAISPLVDAIPAVSCALSIDQRNATRPGTTNCDIGAVERDATLPTTTTTTTTTTTPTSTSSSTTIVPTTTTSRSTSTSTTMPISTTTSSSPTTSSSTTSSTATITPNLDGSALSASLSASTASVGGSLGVSGSGCPGGQPATVTLDGVGVVTAPTAGATGDFAATVNVPAGATAGPYTVTVTCGRGTVVLGVTLTAVVVAPQSNPATPVTVRGSLPLTGTDPQLLIMLGLLTLAAGLALTVAARFRRQG